MTRTGASRQILLVEDDLMDVLILQRVFKDVGLTHALTHVTNGQEALTYLRDPDQDEPGVILLDLDLPEMTGAEFLQAAQDGGLIREIPVIVVTGSDNPEDRRRSLRLGAAAWVVKSSDYDQFRRKIQQLTSYFGPPEPFASRDGKSLQKEIL